MVNIHPSVMSADVAEASSHLQNGELKMLMFKIKMFLLEGKCVCDLFTHPYITLTTGDCPSFLFLTGAGHRWV